MKQGRSAGQLVQRWGQCGCGTCCLRVASCGVCFMGAAGPGHTFGGSQGAPWVSAGGARRICCRPGPVVCPPTWVAAVAVAQEHGALFYFGFGPVQGRGKMLLVQNSDMVPRQLSRKLWDIRISLRVGRDEGTHVAQVLRGSLAYPGGTYHPGAGPRVQGLLGRQGSTVEGTKEHTTGG